jgi:hypothetical protein
MRLLHRRNRAPRPDAAKAAVSDAIAAGAEASERLASASETHAAASDQAAHEQRTIISELRAMRERNHLAEMILASVRREPPS